MFLRPVITEKSMGAIESANEYTFLVDRLATKHQVKEAVEKTFKVKVVTVRTKVVRGKEKKVGKKGNLVRLADKKRAIVKLTKGQTITLFDLKEGKK